MRRCYCSVILSLCVVLLCRVVPGECQFSAVTNPEPGLHGFFPGTQNITLICEISDSGGDRHATTWSKLTSEDREEGLIRQSLSVGGDSNFVISSQETIGDPPFQLPDTSVLTIVSLTQDLDDIIIFCGLGGEEPLVNFTLRIYYPPALRGVVGEVRKRENEELSMDMAEPGSPPPFPFPSQVSWTKDGEEVESQLSTRVFNYSSIFIGSVQPSDSGLYRLSATNFLLDSDTILGSDTANFTLNVLFGAGFADRGPETVVVVEGGIATLICGTGLSGDPLPTITWTDNHGREAVAGGRIFLNSTGRDVVSLSLNGARENDAGYWNCSAQVYDGDVVVGGPVEWDIQLVVVVPPVAPVDLSAKDDGPTWIYLQWFNPSNGRGSPPLSSHVITVQEVGGQSMERTFGGEGAANVTGLLPGTEYIFSVVAVSESSGVRANSPPSNVASGATTFTVPLVVCQQPKVEDGELVISWTYTHTGGLNITNTRVLYRVDNISAFLPLPTSYSGSGSSGSGSGRETYSLDSTSVSMPLPVAGVTYYFRVIASNGEGSNTKDCPGFFLTTGIPGVPDQPELNSCSNDGVNLTLSTDNSGVENTTLDNFQFILHVCDAVNESVLLVDVVVLPVMCSSDGGQCYKTHVISNLSLSSQSYNISVAASNRYGASEHSAVFTIPGEYECIDNSEPTLPIIVLIGASVGGLALVVALALLVIAVICVVRGRNKNNDNSKENLKSPTYVPTTPVVAVDLRPPLVTNTLHFIVGQDSFETYDNCITYEAPDNEEQTTFTTCQPEEALYQQQKDVIPTHNHQEEALYQQQEDVIATHNHEEEALYEQHQEVIASGPPYYQKEEVAEAPVPDNDVAMYETMVLEAGAEDDDYEELTTPAYDVPRRAIAAYSGEAPAYNNVVGDGINERPTVVYSYTSTSRLV